MSLEKQKVEENEKEAVNWRKWASYPKQISTRAQEQLDLLATLLPEPDVDDDRYYSMAKFLDAGVEQGLITIEEKSYLRMEIGPHM